MSITQDLVKELFYYEDGVLYYKVKTCNRIRKGQKAGGMAGDGYLHTSINSKKYKNHRIIFLMFKGFLPAVIDHIDGNPLNNNINNLRPATTSQNLQNAKLSKANTSGIKGVTWEKDRKKWKAQLMFNGQVHRLGSFDDIELAALVIEEARLKHHKEFARHG